MQQQPHYYEQQPQQQPAPQHYPQQPYPQQLGHGTMAGRDNLTEYKTKPSWALAWGLLWRWWVMILPLYGIIALLAMLIKK